MSRSLLFLPVSGPFGSGEFMRCRIIAEAAHDRWPGDRIEFVVNRTAPYADDLSFETVLVDRSPTFHVQEVNDLIRRRKPDVVIFDNAGRKAQMRCARENGARTVFISSRPRRRRKAFRPDRMRLISQHWIAQPEASLGALTTWEALVVRLMGQLKPLFLGSIFHPSQEERRMDLRRKLGVDVEPYVLFCHGGGDLSGEDQGAPRVFTEAAEEIARASGQRAIVVAGRSHAGEVINGQRVVTVGNLSNELLIDLLHDASLIVSGGGAGLIGQILAHRKVCVSVSFAEDQRKRLQQCSELGLLEKANLEVREIRDVALSLLTDRERRRQIRNHIDFRPITNGLSPAIDALAALRRA
ncbi:MAG: hypothetical protein K8R59_00285 [Thermoanaerobaculales bacterium]|nr:hypothetical protein [Thermoanaerobaculales bacterium]